MILDYYSVYDYINRYLVRIILKVTILTLLQHHLGYLHLQGMQLI